ncbi:MAG: FimV/HubP family polar landmark protein, partial [Betaproteobacteria bacterium]
GNNMHRLRRGSLLTVPSPEVIRAVEPDQARQVLRTHTKDFARYQRQLAEHSALRPSSKSAAPTDTVKPATTQSSGGSVTVKMTDAGPTPKSQDKLTLSPPADKRRGALASDTAKAIDAVVTDKALADANARIATLEKNISEMQSLLETKNRALSGSQPPTASDATSAENLPTPSVEGAAEKSGANPPVVPSAAPHSAPTSKQVPKPATLPGAVADQEVSLPQIDPWVGAIAAGGLLTFAILWRRQRRNHNRADGAAAAPVEPTLAQTMMAGAVGQQIDTAHSVFHSNFVPSLSQIDTHEVDAVAEADVYIAYGRDEQAEEILRDALRLHPERHTLRVKLLEIYAARKDRQRFNTLAAELHVLTQGQGPDWARAALLGQSLEPLDALYHASTSAAPVHASASITRSSPMSAPLSDSSVGDRNIIHPPETATPHVIDFNLSPITQTERSLDPSKSAAGDRPTTLGPMTQSAASSSMLNTKLELALACREIGDHAGARELLTEVANARDPELAQRAQSLLLQLA